MGHNEAPVQFFILDGNDGVLGGTSIEASLWRMGDEGFSNESTVRVILSVRGKPERYRYVTGSGKELKHGKIEVPNWDDTDPPGQLIFWPGAMSVEIGRIVARGEVP